MALCPVYIHCLYYEITLHLQADLLLPALVAILHGDIFEC